MSETRGNAINYLAGLILNARGREISSYPLRVRWLKNFLAANAIRFTLVFVNFILLLMIVCLFLKAKPILLSGSITQILISSSWHPLKGQFGFLPFIIGSVEVTLIAMVISVPVCLLTAIYLSEYAHRHLERWVRLVIDMLAGIPSVIFGLWGVIVVVPIVRELGLSLGIQTTGYCLLSGGIILALIVIPIIISVSLEVLRTTPGEARESSLALGITKWEMVKHVILKRSSHGLIAAVVLGFARAFGETIAVMMVVGNVVKIPGSLFDPAYPLPALIANNYGEMMSIPLYDSALMLAALILMVVVGGFSLAANMVVIHMERRSER
jgi:phosphate transport system permease protein